MIIAQNNINHNFNTTVIRNEKKVLYVIALTAITMALELVAGSITGSMAIIAHGWHMGTHLFALGITYCAYIMARHFKDTKTFTFGTGKFGILAAYTSSLLLGVSAIYMIYESSIRLVQPVGIAFNEAIIVAVISSVINVACIIVLSDTGAPHNHWHKHKSTEDKSTAHKSPEYKESINKEPAHKEQDQNLRAAYIHVSADALTSILTIIALIFGRFLGWTFLDPVMGIVGGLLIITWAYNLFMNSGLILLDGTKDKVMYEAVSKAIVADGDSIIRDLHVWPLNENVFAAVITISTNKDHTPTEYHERLAGIAEIKHITIEVHYDSAL